MEPLLQKVLVVGGNGFIGEQKRSLDFQNIESVDAGSAICKAALAKGLQVTSIRFVFNSSSQPST